MMMILYQFYRRESAICTAQVHMRFDDGNRRTGLLVLSIVILMILDIRHRYGTDEPTTVGLFLDQKVKDVVVDNGQFTTPAAREYRAHWSKMDWDLFLQMELVRTFDVNTFM